jgi:DNA-binding MarR family transcriptional regulator
MNKRMTQIDPETGEIQEGCMVWIPHRPKIKERFFMGFQDALIEIAKDPEITQEPHKLLLFLFGHLDYENYIHISQKEMAEELGMQTSHVSRAMSLLCRKHIVELAPGTGRTKCYRLNPHFGWKGKVTNLNEARKKQLHLIQGGLANESPSARMRESRQDGGDSPGMDDRPRDAA